MIQDILFPAGDMAIWDYYCESEYQDPVPAIVYGGIPEQARIMAGSPPDIVPAVLEFF